MNISTDHVHPKQKSSVKSARSADCRHEPDDWRRGGHPLRHAWHGAGPEAWRTDRGQVEGRYGLRFMYIYILCWKIYVFRLCRDMVFQWYSSVFQKRQATHQRFFLCFLKIFIVITWHHEASFIPFRWALRRAARNRRRIWTSKVSRSNPPKNC